MSREEEDAVLADRLDQMWKATYGEDGKQPATDAERLAHSVERDRLIREHNNHGILPYEEEVLARAGAVAAFYENEVRCGRTGNPNETNERSQK